jgi:hypothetical protein
MVLKGCLPSNNNMEELSEHLETQGQLQALTKAVQEKDSVCSNTNRRVKQVYHKGHIVCGINLIVESMKKGEGI